MKIEITPLTPVFGAQITGFSARTKPGNLRTEDRRQRGDFNLHGLAFLCRRFYLGQ